MVPSSVALAPLHQKVESEEKLRKEREREDDRRASRTCDACAELCVKEAGCYVLGPEILLPMSCVKLGN